MVELSNTLMYLLIGLVLFNLVVAIIVNILCRKYEQEQLFVTELDNRGLDCRSNDFIYKAGLKLVLVELGMLLVVVGLLFTFGILSVVVMVIGVMLLLITPIVFLKHFLNNLKGGKNES